MHGFAARYSNNIARDIERGFSFAGWGHSPEPTEEAARAALVRTDYDADGNEREIAYDGEIAHCPEAQGYLPALAGLSAYWAEDADEAVELARADDRFDGIALYVFPAEYLDDDQDAAVFGAGSAIVRATGPATLIED
jgi:hypothetical protein